MNKLLIILTACAFGLVLSSTGIAADQMAPEKDKNPAAAQDSQPAPDEKAGGMTADTPAPTDPQATPTDKPTSVAADKATKPADASEAYTAALKKCEALTGTQKDTCEKNAKKEYGKM
jgi:hypothetical protein